MHPCIDAFPAYQSGVLSLHSLTSVFCCCLGQKEKKGVGDGFVHFKLDQIHSITNHPLHLHLHRLRTMDTSGELKTSIILQEFKDKEGNDLDSLPTHFDESSKVRSVLWSKIERMFDGIDYIASDRYALSRVFFMVDDNFQVYDFNRRTIGKTSYANSIPLQGRLTALLLPLAIGLFLRD